MSLERFNGLMKTVGQIITFSAVLVSLTVTVTSKASKSEVRALCDRVTAAELTFETKTGVAEIDSRLGVLESSTEKDSERNEETFRRLESKLDDIIKMLLDEGRKR